MPRNFRLNSLARRKVRSLEVFRLKDSPRFILHCRVTRHAGRVRRGSRWMSSADEKSARFQGLSRRSPAEGIAKDQSAAVPTPARYLQASLGKRSRLDGAPQDIRMKVIRDTRAAWPLSKAGAVPVMGIYPWNSVTAIHARSRTSPPATSNVRKAPKPATLAPQERRHSFAIEALPRGEKFRSRPYLYMCVRCRWTFRVNDRPGSIVSLDESGQPLAEPENSRRAATFSAGPCPETISPLLRQRTIEIPPLGWFARIRHRVMRQVSGMWRHWAGQNARGIRIDPAATTTIMADDLLR